MIHLNTARPALQSKRSGSIRRLTTIFAGTQEAEKVKPNNRLFRRKKIENYTEETQLHLLLEKKLAGDTAQSKPELRSSIQRPNK